MKKKYTYPELELLLVNDVIVTSVDPNDTKEPEEMPG